MPLEAEYHKHFSGATADRAGSKGSGAPTGVSAPALAKSKMKDDKPKAEAATMG
jgi:hypothetical protein